MGIKTEVYKIDKQLNKNQKRLQKARKLLEKGELEQLDKLLIDLDNNLEYIKDHL